MKESNKTMKRQINLLTGYAIVSSMLFAFFILSSFNTGANQDLELDELTVKKINLIGEDGSLRMVISNETRQHSGRMGGVDFPKRDRPAGILFYNDEGDECGGIIAKVGTENGSTISGMSFTMDNYLDDQVIQILNAETYNNGNAEIQRGLSINEFPLGTNLVSRTAKLAELEKIEDSEERQEKMRALWNKEGSRRRLFVGRNINNDSGLFLYDINGKPKMKIYVDKNGDPKIEVIDENGNAKNIINLE